VRRASKGISDVLPAGKVFDIALEALMVTLCAGSAFLFFLVRIAQLTGYFWPLLASETLNNLSVALLAFHHYFIFCVSQP